MSEGRWHAAQNLRLPLAAVALAAVAALAGAPAAATQAPARPAATPRFDFGPVGAIQKVADNLYVVPGGGGNTTVWVAPAGVVVVDMKAPGNGQAVLDRIRSVTDKPILHVVNTHVHFDHTGGNLALPEAVEVVAHANLEAALAKDPGFQGPDAKRGLVDRTYTDRLTLLSGDDAVDLYNFGPSHTNGDSFVVFRKARALATGDVFAGKGQPILDAMNGGSGVAYPDALSKAVATIADVDLVIPGHAGVMRWQDLLHFTDFNRRFLAHARTALAAGQTPLQAMEEFRSTLPATFKDYTLGAGMFTGPGGNFEPIFRELQTLAPSVQGPWLGIWKLNVEKSTYQTGKPPAGTNRTYAMSATGPDSFDVVIDSTSLAGVQTMHMETKAARFDGKDYVEVGNPIADANRFRIVGERSYEFVESKRGVDVITITVEISPDGKTRTSRQQGRGPDGRPTLNVAVWDRQ